MYVLHRQATGRLQSVVINFALDRSSPVLEGFDVAHALVRITSSVGLQSRC